MKVRYMKRRYFGFVGCPNAEGLPYNNIAWRRFQIRGW